MCLAELAHFVIRSWSPYRKEIIPRILFLMPNEKYFYTSSQLIKQVHLFGERETDLVPENVLTALREVNRSNRGGEPV